MSGPRAIKRERARNAAKVEQQVAAQQMGPYRIRAVQIVTEVEFFSPITGKITDRKATDPAMIYENDSIFPALLAWLRTKGLNPVEDEPKPKEAEVS